MRSASVLCCRGRTRDGLAGPHSPTWPAEAKWWPARGPTADAPPTPTADAPPTADAAATGPVPAPGLAPAPGWAAGAGRAAAAVPDIRGISVSERRMAATGTTAPITH